MFVCCISLRTYRLLLQRRKGCFYRELSRLICSAKSSEVVIVAGDMNAQVKRLHSFESHLGGHFSVDAQRTDNGVDFYNYAPIINSTWPASIFNINDCIVSHGNRRVLLRRRQLDYFAVSRRWRGSIQDCRSFWCTPLVSDHAILRARLLIRFPRSKWKQSAKQPVPSLHATSAQKYRLELVSNLKSGTT